MAFLTTELLSIFEYFGCTKRALVYHVEHEHIRPTIGRRCLLGLDEEVAFKVFDASIDVGFTTVLFFQTDLDHDELANRLERVGLEVRWRAYLVCKRWSPVIDRDVGGDANFVGQIIDRLSQHQSSPLPRPWITPRTVLAKHSSNKVASNPP